MKMKKILIPIISLFIISSCDYQEINTNIHGVTDEETKKGGLTYGAPLMNMQQLVIPIGSPSLSSAPGNHLQNTDLISSGNYIGYFGNNNNWNFSIESNWNFVEARMSYAYENFYSNLFRSWNEIKKVTEKSNEPYDQEVFAIANIIKTVSWLRATDVFGPIVYTNAGNGDIAPKLDSQEVVYKNMLAELAHSVEVLQNASPILLGEYDLIYNGRVQNWIKLANSLMLRMAVRVHFKNEALAKEYITIALDPQKGGVIAGVEDEAKIQNSGKMPLLNSMMPSVEEYGETRMGATIWSYLKGYDDPRINNLFTKGTYDGKEDFFPIAPTNGYPKKEGKNSPQFASKPNINANSPLYWFRASETYFLKAEAALYGLITGDAKSLYEEGVQMSFTENGAGSADSYLASENKATDIARYEYPYAMSYSHKLSKGNTSPQWDDYNSESALSTKDQQLQKIITQKYLALYPNAVEAWTEYRRTGFPYLMKPLDPDAPARIGAADDTMTPERFRFAPSEYSGNPNMSQVPTLLGGEDTGATKLWWVRGDRPKQPK